MLKNANGSQVFLSIERVRSQSIFGGGVNAMMGAGFPVMAWGGLGVFQGYWSMGCEGQNEAEKTCSGNRFCAEFSEAVTLTPHAM